MTWAGVGVKTPGTTGPWHGTWAVWTWIADHPQHRPDPVGVDTG